MSQNHPAKQPTKSLQVNEGAVKQFLEIQKDEMDIRKQELSLREKDQQNSFILAQESLRQQGEYLKRAPKFLLQNKLMNYGFVAVVLIIIVGLIIFCIIENKVDIAIRVIEIAGTAILSGAGGYFYGRTKTTKNKGPQAEIIEDDDN